MPLRSNPHPTQKDVARKADVTGATVSRALRGDPHVKPGTRQRIERIAEELGYRPNPVVGHLMAQLRMGQKESYKATLAMISPMSRARLMASPPQRKFIEGATSRATEMGYALESFWMREPGVSIARWKQILDSRNIRGILVTGLFHYDDMLPEFKPVWENRACVLIGARSVDAPLHFCGSDLFSTSTLALRELARLGYRKPAFIIADSLDIHLERRLSGGFLAGYDGIRTSPSMILRMDYPPDVPHMLKWIRRQRPDVIICNDRMMLEWLREGGIRVPDEVGVVRVDLHCEEPGWAGIKQNSDLVARAAIDLLIGQLHCGEVGDPPFQKGVLIEGTWVSGTTVRASAKRNFQKR